MWNSDRTPGVCTPKMSLLLSPVTLHAGQVAFLVVPDGDAPCPGLLQYLHFSPTPPRPASSYPQQDVKIVKSRDDFMFNHFVHIASSYNCHFLAGISCYFYSHPEVAGQ